MVYILPFGAMLVETTTLSETDDSTPVDKRLEDDADEPPALANEADETPAWEDEVDETPALDDEADETPALDDDSEAPAEVAVMVEADGREGPPE